MSANSSEIIIGALASQMVQGTIVHVNLAQNAIVITEDKVKLCLIEHLSRTEARREWTTPGGILLTILVIFPTTTFQDFGLAAATWKAMFVIGALAAGVWLVKAIIRCRNAPTVDDIVATMKRASVPTAGGPPPAA